MNEHAHVTATQQPTVGDYMTKMPLCIELDADLVKALALMQEHGIRHLPVMDGPRLEGVVSERDLSVIESLLPEEWQQVSVAEAMTPAPYTVRPDTPLSDVAKHMAQQKLGCAVVTGARGEVIGLFTTTDALQVLAELTVEGS